MHRRDFLSAMLAASIAPAFVPVSRLMKVAPIVLPPVKPLVDTLVPPNTGAVIRIYDGIGRTLAEVPFTWISASQGAITLRQNGLGYVENTGTFDKWDFVNSDGMKVVSGNSDDLRLNTKSLTSGCTLHFLDNLTLNLS